MRFICYLVGSCLLCGATSAAEVIDFDTDVVPLLSKAGCNAASCHGSAAGQAGFRLSLFGGDPNFDYRSIVNELEGRRVNQVTPIASLLLAKPTGQLDHGGGEVLEPDGEAVRVIAQWVEEGAHRKNLRHLERLMVTPDLFAADSTPTTLQIKVVAVFDDGLQRDVTRTAVYVSQNDAVLTVDEAGEATVRHGGQHTAIVRFGDQVTTVTATSPIGSEVPTLLDTVRANWIDDEINAKLVALRLVPALEIDDAAFVRRVSLDLTGRLPLPAMAESFVSDSSLSET